MMIRIMVNTGRGIHIMRSKVILSINAQEVGWFGVGWHECVAIKEFGVNGEMSYVSWYRIEYEDNHTEEINGKYVIKITYKKEEKEDD